jgi:hypothetical protein
MMTIEEPTLPKQLERALALAYAALDDATPRRVADAQSYAAGVLTQLARLRGSDLAPGERRRITEPAELLRQVLQWVEHKVERDARNSAPPLEQRQRS